MTGNVGKAGRMRKKKRLDRLIYLLAAVLLMEAAVLVYLCYQKDREKEDRFRQLGLIEDLRDVGSNEGDANDAGSGGEDGGILPAGGTELDNPDWIGWVEIPGTGFSYPVMQREGDWQYYLHRDFDGNYSFYGMPFLDWRCSPGSDNLIVYGHNINGGRMFGALHAYADEGYYQAHPQISLRIRDERHAYQVVSVLQADTASPAYNFTDTGNWEDYKDSVREILLGAAYRTGMSDEIKKEMERLTDEEFFRKYQFLTLSTCRSWLGRDKRLLVVAARER